MPNDWISIPLSSISAQDNDEKLRRYLPPELYELITGESNKNQQKDDNLIVPKEKVLYDFKMVNCDQDLKELTTKLKKSKIKQYGILLYGVSGTGKSQFGKYLAQELKMPILKKRASDLTAKFVGETEQNIKAAFAEAREKKAILLIDESDSFLFDRRYAKQDYQASHVNEILTQMEDHPYPFIMTTNLKDKIDNAAFRRFIFKIKFNYMKPENILAGIKTYFGKGIKLKQEELNKLTYICAGDFKVAKTKIDILDNSEYTAENIFKYLLKEQSEKNIIKGSNKISI